jgi:hypothetical protein
MWETGFALLKQDDGEKLRSRSWQRGAHERGRRCATGVGLFRCSWPQSFENSQRVWSYDRTVEIKKPMTRPVPRAGSEVYRAQPLAGGELGPRHLRSFSCCGAERHLRHPVGGSSDINNSGVFRSPMTADTASSGFRNQPNERLYRQNFEYRKTDTDAVSRSTKEIYKLNKYMMVLIYGELMSTPPISISLVSS